MRLVDVLACRRRVPVAVAFGALIAAMSWPVPVVGAADATDRILFVRSDANADSIYGIDVDGSNLTRIGSGSSPAWSPDGRRIAFADHSEDGSHDIYVMDADGSNPRRLTTSSEYHESDPSWSPDGRRIAYSRQDQACCVGAIEDEIVGERRLWVMNADGSDPTRLPTGSDDAWDTSPSWSPDGTSIAFDRFQAREPRSILVLDLEAGRESMVTASRDWGPTWSADGRITFATDRHARYSGSTGSHKAGRTELYRMNADGTDQTRLTHSDAAEFSASWSPDGEVVAFVRDPDGGARVGFCGLNEPACEEDTGELPGAIHVMNADGSGERTLTSPPDDVYDWGPHFRPDPSRVPAISRTQIPAEPRADTQEGTRSGAQAREDVGGRGSLSAPSEGSMIADRAPSAEGVGIAGEVDDAAPTSTWTGGALLATGLAGGLVLFAVGWTRRTRSRDEEPELPR